MNTVKLHCESNVGKEPSFTAFSLEMERFSYPFLPSEGRLLVVSAVVSAEEEDCGMDEGARGSDVVGGAGRGNRVFSLPSVGSCTEGEVRGMMVL